MLKIFMNNRGVTLIEVLVSAAMTAIVSLGIATMMQNSMKEQRKIVIMDTLKNQKQRFEFLIRDQAAWTQTVQNAANTPTLFNEIRSTSQITEVPYSTPVKIILFDASGSSSSTTLLGPADTSGRGFTEKGAVCNGFDSTVGNGTDACPFSYKVMIGADCAAGASCGSPQLKIVARLVYNPSPTGTLREYANLIQTISGTDISDTVSDGKYDASVKRTTSSVNRSFRIVAKHTPSGAPTDCSAAPPAGGGAGACSVGAWATHPVTATTVPGQGWSEDYDPNGLVTNPPASPNIRFTETGYYSCMISVPAFATQGFSISLYNSTSNTDIATGNTTAGLWAQATAIIDAKFNVTSTSHDFVIRQKCDALPGGTPSANNCTLGMSPSGSYAVAQVVVSMSCYKLDRSM